MIHYLLPAPVQVAEAFADRADVALFPEEQAAIAAAVDKRRREFTTVRACARDALASLGLPPTPLVPGPRGAPRWPAGVIGSMTHCEGYRAAAVARQTTFRSVGIDAEPYAPLPEGVLEVISVPEDFAGLDRLVSTGVAADRVLFSAKESVYKTWFPLARRWLGFQDATVALRADGTFTARLLVDGTIDDGPPLCGFEGRWLVHSGLVITAIAVPVD